MWVVLAFISALCLGGYDISKKIALRDSRVVDVLTCSILISSLILSVPLILSRLCPEWMTGTALFVPRLDMQAHLLTLLKSCIVLSSWVFTYISLKHLPISVVSPLQATRPMWTLVGALLIFGERLNAWQWVGIILAIGSIFVFSFRKPASLHVNSLTRSSPEGASRSISRVLYPCGCLSLISGRVLPRASLASYPPANASSARTPVYLELQPTVCSFHFTRLCSRDQTLLPGGR